MEDSETQKRIISLGEKLVKELKGQRLDTFARWMAHYIAEQMTIAKSAKGNDKIKAEKRCFDAILKLWQHRSSWPDNARPFKNFEPIFRALERLDPKNPTRYFRLHPGFDQFDSYDAVKDNDNAEVHEWLKLVKVIDQTARICLDHAFQQAALNATDEKTLAWIEKAAEFSENDDISIVVRLLGSDLSDLEESVEFVKQAQELKRDELKLGIDHLDLFLQFGQELRAVFLADLESITKDDSSVSP